MRNLRMYLAFLRVQYLSALQYKGWPLMIVQVIFVCISDFISTLLLFLRFGQVGEWTLERIALTFSMALTAFGLAECFCRGFDSFPFQMIRNGDFDRVLLRPRSLPWQIAASRFHIHRLARVGVGMAMILWSLTRMGVAMGPRNVLLLVGALLGGFLMYTGVFIFTSGIAFFTVQSVGWIYLFTNASYQVARCPIDFLPRLLRSAFTFALPMLLISYYPAAAICGWGEPLWAGSIALPVGLCFLCLSCLIWRFGVRHYKSTGS